MEKNNEEKMEKFDEVSPEINYEYFFKWIRIGLFFLNVFEALLYILGLFNQSNSKLAIAINSLTWGVILVSFPAVSFYMSKFLMQKQSKETIDTLYDYSYKISDKICALLSIMVLTLFSIKNIWHLTLLILLGIIQTILIFINENTKFKDSDSVKKFTLGTNICSLIVIFLVTLNIVIRETEYLHKHYVVSYFAALLLSSFFIWLFDRYVFQES